MYRMKESCLNEYALLCIACGFFSVSLNITLYHASVISEAFTPFWPGFESQKLGMKFKGAEVK